MGGLNLISLFGYHLTPDHIILDFHIRKLIFNPPAQLRSKQAVIFAREGDRYAYVYVSLIVFSNDKRIMNCQ